MNSQAYVTVLIFMLWILPSTTCHIPNGMDTLVEITNTATQGASSIYVFDEQYEGDVKTLLNNTRSQYSLYNSKGFVSALDDILRMTLENNPPGGFRSYLHIVVFCGAECIERVLQTATELDNTVGQRSMLRHFSTWLIISPDVPVTLNVTLDHVAWVTIDIQHKNQLRNISQLWEHYPFGTDKDKQGVSLEGASSLMWIPEGREWASVDTCNISYFSIFPNFKGGLNGRRLRATALEWNPFTIRTVLKGEVTFVGAAVDMFQILADAYNFSFVVDEPDDKSWGKALENITLTGIIGQINRAEFDFCVVPYAISINREKVTDMTYPVIGSGYHALYSKIEDENTWAYLVSSFTWRTYLYGMGTWVIALGIAFTWNLVSKDRSKIGFIFEIGFSIPLRQNIETHNFVFGASSRIFIFSWCVFCFLITTVYIGNLVAFATVDKQTTPFDTLEDIANQHEYPVGVLDGGYAQGIVMTSTDPVLINIKRKVVHINTTVYEDSNQMLQNILQKKYILISPGVYTNYLKSKSCEIFLTKKSFFPINSGFIFPPLSPLKRIFENEFLRLRDLGTLYKLTTKWTPKTMECEKPVVDPRFQFKHLNTVGVTISFLVLLAFCILLLELCRQKSSLILQSQLQQLY